MNLWNQVKVRNRVMGLIYSLRYQLSCKQLIHNRVMGQINSLIYQLSCKQLIHNSQIKFWELNNKVGNNCRNMRKLRPIGPLCHICWFSLSRRKYASRVPCPCRLNVVYISPTIHLASGNMCVLGGIINKPTIHI